MSKNEYPIEFCGNCGIGEKTKEDNPCSCDYFAPSDDRRCNSWTAGHYPNRERVVFICSPLKGNIENNLQRAKAFCKAAVNSGAIPICPHLYFSSFLDDRNKHHRTAGMAMGIELLKRCDELWAFGEPSEGMKAEITEAKAMRMPIVFIAKGDSDKIVEEAQKQCGSFTF